MSDLIQNIQYYIALIIDVSDSMKGEHLQEAKNAYISLINSFIDSSIADFSQFEFAVIPFGSDASLYAPLNAAEAILAIEGLSLKGFTNFNPALEKANEFFSTASPTATNVAYFLSDGFSNTGNFTNEAEALKAVADVQAYGIGAANIQELIKIDSNQPVIVNQASELASEFADSVADLIESMPQTSQEPEVDNNIPKVVSSVDPSGGDQLPVLSVQDVSIKEGDIGTSTAQFSVNLSSPATSEVQFFYQTLDRSAISGSDYNETSGQIIIPVGETIANIDIHVNGDTEIESNEEFTLNLKDLSGATFENNEPEYSKVATIENDDVAQTSSIVPSNVTESTQIPDNGNILDGNLLNLESFTGEVEIIFTVGREALFDNTVGFYKIKDAQGTIKDPITGNNLKPTDGEAYAQLALQLREPEIQLTVDNLSSSTIENTLFGGHIYAPFIIADGNIDTLEGDLSQVYFSFAEANSDGVEHVRFLGDNTLGFEDLPGGGDRDFDDMVVTTGIVKI